MLFKVFCLVIPPPGLVYLGVGRSEALLGVSVDLALASSVVCCLIGSTFSISDLTDFISGTFIGFSESLFSPKLGESSSLFSSISFTSILLASSLS